MNISSNAPISGMNAASLRQDNIAHNVANVNTPDFRAQRIEQTETVSRPAQAQATDTYEPGSGTAAYAAGTDRPDLARDMTDMVTVQNAYTANAESARVQNEVAGTAIDLVG